MCGIAGIINFDSKPVSTDILKSMNSAMIHRGPDDEGYFFRENIGLAHRRLSIIDLGTGAQPMCNEDSSIWLVFNGEIYNFKDLRTSLAARGHTIKTLSDTETIIHLYEEYGTECLKQLNGMFAFALYDSRNKLLFLARDRSGKKPLYYFMRGSVFVFASELQALRRHPEMPSDYNCQAIHDYFSLQYIPCPATVYQGVFKLPPATFMQIGLNDRSSKTENYWKIKYTQKTKLSFQAASQRLRDLMEDAVRDRLTADVPLGTFLSGGIDSTIISGLTAKLSNDTVKAFTIGFNEAKYDERRYADAAVRYINKHSKNEIMSFERIVRPDDLNVIKKLVRHCGEPFSDSSILPSYFLTDFTREHVTVALSGDGADELFAGYNRYLVIKLAAMIDKFPNSPRELLIKAVLALLPEPSEQRNAYTMLHRLMKVLNKKPQERYPLIMSKCDERLKHSMEGSRLRDAQQLDTQRIIQELEQHAEAVSQTEKVMEADFHSYLPSDILAKIDCASMANSLEVRSPFLDTRVIEFAASLPLEYKLCGTSRKHILKSAFKDIIPPQISRRSKLGFGVPMAEWFRNQWLTPAREQLLEGLAVRDGFLNKKCLETMLNSHLNGKADFSYELWSAMVFDIFLQNNN